MAARSRPAITGGIRENDLMGRGRIQGEARGKLCKSCGLDEWRQYTKGKDGKKVWYCMPCNRGNQSALRSNVAWLLWNSARHRARRQGLPFTITAADVSAAWPADNRCALSGERLQFEPGKSSADTPTLERIDTAAGFEPGNIFVVGNSAAAIRRHRERTHKAASA